MEILRYAAFSADPAGGNPAGVVLDASGADGARMLAAAADVGYSETAFLVARADGEFDIRYFSPLAEVPFCGHATIATAVAYAQRHGPGVLRLHTAAGLVDVTTVVTGGADGSADGNTDGGAAGGAVTATLVSVPPRTTELSDVDLEALLELFGWVSTDLDATLPPRVAYAGAWHPILATTSRRRLAELRYDLPSLGALMAARDWTTIDLVWRESETVFHVRNPFPPGGVFEDPATGAAAAAFGGYLRELGLVTTPATVTVHQGEDMGRPGLITVGIGPDPASGIAVSGRGVRLPDG